MRRIYFTVTNDLIFDQRMHRICHSLSTAGYEVCLVGRSLKTSRPMQLQSFLQKRIRCFFNRGFLFYTEFNLRLFFFLLFRKMDVVCSIDLDTILAGLLVTKLKRIKRVYDAHEYFTEMKEVRSRKLVKKIWEWIQDVCVPRYEFGYTVSDGLAEAFYNKYHRQYLVIRNFPVLKPLDQNIQKERFLVYQGAVNEARGFEYLIPALKKTGERLVVCGDGNFMNRLVQLIQTNKIQQQVELKGMMLPEELREVAQRATLGIGLAEKEGVNQYHSLANKFTDYIHAGLPQIAMNFPEYEKINQQYEVAVLLKDLSPDTIAENISRVINDAPLLEKLHKNCLHARNVFNWQTEEKHLLDFYKKILPFE